MRNNRFRYLLRYFLVRNKFATYYFLQSTESLQKKIFTIFLVLLSLPLRGCKFLDFTNM